jgi:major type 1 subunit fimbrin (pilin)
MKKFLLATLTLTASLTGSYAVAAMPYDGTINFVGAAVGSTCKLAGADFTVVLPMVAIGNAPVGTTLGATGFNIQLTDCPVNVAKASTYFMAGNNLSASGNLKNQGTATAIELQLLNGDSSVIDLSKGEGMQNSKSVSVSEADGSANMLYAVQYLLTGRASSGSVSSSVTYSIMYH